MNVLNYIRTKTKLKGGNKVKISDIKQLKCKSEVFKNILNYIQTRRKVVMWNEQLNVRHSDIKVSKREYDIQKK